MLRDGVRCTTKVDREGDACEDCLELLEKMIADLYERKMRKAIETANKN
jgi:hypothetical protein